MRERLKPFFPSNIYQEILVLCSFQNLSGKQNDELKNIIKSNEIDWKVVIIYFQKNKVKALALNNLLVHGSTELLPEDLAMLKRHMQTTLIRNLKKVGQLKMLLNLLNEHKIPLIPWKGPLLSHIIFNQSVSRTFGDLDVIIQEKYLWKAKELLIQNGYIPFWKMTKQQELAYTKHRHSYEFLKDDGIDVELHWKLAKDQYHFKVSMDEFWETSSEYTFLEEKINIPSKENLIIGVAIHHGGVECWLSYKLIIDWFYLLETYHDADWELVLKKSNDLGIRRIVLVGTLICQSVFGYEIPTVLKKVVQQKEVELAEKIIGNIFNENKLIKQSSFLLELRERPLHKLKVAYKILSTPSLIDEYASIFPKWFTIFERPIRLVNKFILKKEDSFLNQYSNR